MVMFSVGVSGFGLTPCSLAFGVCDLAVNGYRVGREKRNRISPISGEMSYLMVGNGKEREQSEDQVMRQPGMGRRGEAGVMKDGHPF